MCYISLFITQPLDDKAFWWVGHGSLPDCTQKWVLPSWVLGFSAPFPDRLPPRVHWFLEVHTETYTDAYRGFGAPFPSTLSPRVRWFLEGLTDTSTDHYWRFSAPFPGTHPPRVHWFLKVYKPGPPWTLTRDLVHHSWVQFHQGSAGTLRSTLGPPWNLGALWGARVMVTLTLVLCEYWKPCNYSIRRKD